MTMKSLYYKFKNRRTVVKEIEKYKEFIALKYNNYVMKLFGMSIPHVNVDMVAMSLHDDIELLCDRASSILRRMGKVMVLDADYVKELEDSFKKDVTKCLSDLDDALANAKTFLTNNTSVVDFLTENGNGKFYFGDDVLFKLGFVPAVQYYDYTGIVSAMKVNYIYKCYVDVHIEDDMLICRLPNGQNEYYYHSIVKLEPLNDVSDVIQAIALYEDGFSDALKERYSILKLLNNVINK